MLENCKNIKAAGTIAFGSFGNIPLFEMTSDIKSQVVKPKFHLKSDRTARRRYRVCKYSDDCFSCPMPDCVAFKNVSTINVLPDEPELLSVKGR